MAKKQAVTKKKFESRYTNYKKYVQLDGKEVLIKFQNGMYETDDKRIIEVLSKDPFVREVKEGEEENQEQTANSGA